MYAFPIFLLGSMSFSYCLDIASYSVIHSADIFSWFVILLSFDYGSFCHTLFYFCYSQLYLSFSTFFAKCVIKLVLISVRILSGKGNHIVIEGGKAYY